MDKTNEEANNPMETEHRETKITLRETGLKTNLRETTQAGHKDPAITSELMYINYHSRGYSECFKRTLGKP